MNLHVRSSALTRLLAGALSLSLVVFPSMSHAAGPVHVRKEVSKLTPAEVSSLRKGVKVMKSRPPSDPTSWSYQAAMHGSYVTPPLADWNQCQHGSYFFLAWHRMYLYYFERILRASAGDPKLALPYWDYSQKSRARRVLPAPFRVPGNASNSLYVAQRASGLNSGVAAVPRSATSFTAAFAETDFTGPAAVPSFGGQQVPGPGHFLAPHGQLESQPHDVIHDVLGGPTGWMSDPNTAAQDPIFYLHHANIDRLWKRWLAQGGGRANPSDAVFLNTKFFFYDEHGTRVTMTGKDILDTVHQLGYRYDDDPIPSPLVASRSLATLAPGAPARAAANVNAPAPQPVLLASSSAKPPPPPGSVSDLGQGGPRIELGTAPVNVGLDVKAPGQARLQELAVTPGAQARPILLNVEGINFDRDPGVYYEIYVNLPKEQAANPDFESPYYVGNLGFFGLKHDHAGHHPGGGVEGERVYRTYDITRVLSNLKSRPEWNGQLKVTLVMKGLVNVQSQKAMPVPEGTKARIARVDILGL